MKATEMSRISSLSMASGAIFVFSFVASSDALSYVKNGPRLGAEFQLGQVNVMSSNPQEIDKNGQARGIYGFWKDDAPLGHWAVGFGVQSSYVRGNSESRGVKQIFDVIAPFIHSHYLLSVNEAISIGPSLRNQFGRGSEYEAQNPDRWAYVLALGAAAEYAWRINEWEPTASLSYYMDVNNEERRVSTFLAGIGVALSFGLKQEAKPEPNEEATPAPQPVVKPEESVAEKREPVVVTLDGKMLNFDLGKSTIKPESLVRMKKLGKALASLNSAWVQISVTGHTDKSGRRESNQKLSSARANAVCQVFVEAGMDRGKLKCEGFADDKLLSGFEPNAAEHRRVEFAFDGIDPNQSVALKAAIEQALK